MDRYELFQKLLTLLADDAEITNAKMKNYSDDIEIIGETEGHQITIRVSIKDNEASGDGD